MLSFLCLPFRFNFIHSSRSKSKASERKSPPPINHLPVELILLISSHLPSYSMASLALSSKQLFLSLDQTWKQDLNLPAEQPPNFEDSSMSEPAEYQFSRWTFLTMLEKDLAGRWMLCSQCFKLHPSSQFPEAQLLRDPHERSCCSRWPCTVANGFGRLQSLAGIVDLCPCIKLTAGMRRNLVDHLRMVGVPSKTAHQVKNPGIWHKRRHLYKDVEVRIEIDTFLRQDKNLGVVVKYVYTCSAQSSTVFPRLCCPHRKLDTWVSDVLKCRDSHPEQESCAKCLDIQDCRYCKTVMIGLTSSEDATSNRISYSFRIESMLADWYWDSQIIFPFKRWNRTSSDFPRRSPWVSLYSFQKQTY